MAIELGRMMTSLAGLLPIMSHDPLITWPCEIRGSLKGGGSTCKRLSCHRFLVIRAAECSSSFSYFLVAQIQ